jgi:hypothetical protein
MPIYKERWGPLLARYEDTTKPRKMLALDGGGIRGVLTLQILKRMEELLAARTGAGDSFRLCDYFDYIAGTSTGCIIAAGLARGMSAQDLIDFYKNSGEQMFEKRWLLARLQSFYSADPLRHQLQTVFGADTTLEPQHLKCLLLAVTRNATTDSPWPISSNPDAKYNDPARDDCNLRIPLWQLVRASTAAPVYFPPEVISLEKNVQFAFVDGGVTPYNNPAFLLFRMATTPAYRLAWKTGEKNLLLISVGTGATDEPTTRVDPNLAQNLTSLPTTLMYGIQVDQDVNCRTVGHCTHGAFIDRELDDLTCLDVDGKTRVQPTQDQGRAFLYARYNANISAKGLQDLGLGGLDPEKVRQMDAVDQIPNLIAIGQKAADEVDLNDWGSFVPQAAAGA